MADLTLYFVAAAGLGALLAAAVLTAPRVLPLKIGALAVLALLMPTVYLGLNAMLSRPKPVSIEWLAAPDEDAKVVAAYMDEDEAIYLWLKLAGEGEPRAYRMPWHEQRARELHEAQQAAEQAGTEVVMRKPFARDDRESPPMFHPEPQEAPPPKQTAQRPAIHHPLERRRRPTPRPQGRRR